MQRTGEGLTAVYNRFHDPDERGDDIVALRGLHDAIDRAALDAYGWDNLKAAPEFIARQRDDEDEDSSRPHRLRWRYRWPDDIRDDVLARLLALNAERAAVELLEPETHPARWPRGPKKAVARAKSDEGKRGAR